MFIHCTGLVIHDSLSNMQNPYTSDGNGHIHILLEPYKLGVHCVIDEQDLGIVEKYNWRLVICGHRKHLTYAVASYSGKQITMHRLLLAELCYRIDHKNGDGLDNRRHNIRPATQGQNLMNRGKQVNNTSGFKGVSKSGKLRWKAMIQIHGKDIYLGTFDTKEEAARAYDAGAVQHFKEFAKTNF